MGESGVGGRTDQEDWERERCIEGDKEYENGESERTGGVVGGDKVCVGGVQCGWVGGVRVDTSDGEILGDRVGGVRVVASDRFGDVGSEGEEGGERDWIDSAG